MLFASVLYFSENGGGGLLDKLWYIIIADYLLKTLSGK